MGRPSRWVLPSQVLPGEDMCEESNYYHLGLLSGEFQSQGLRIGSWPGITERWKTNREYFQKSSVQSIAGLGVNVQNYRLLVLSIRSTTSL